MAFDAQSSRSPSRGDSRRESRLTSPDDGTGTETPGMDNATSQPLARSEGVDLVPPAVPLSQADYAVTARIVNLETMDTSEYQDDAEKACGLLPELAVPAPDPKILVIPPEKVRQVVRRPAAARGERPPLLRIEILSSPVLGPSSGKDGTSKEKDETREDKPEVGGRTHKYTGGISGAEREKETRTISGALEGNPYRWVVSFDMAESGNLAYMIMGQSSMCINELT